MFIPILEKIILKIFFLILRVTVWFCYEPGFWLSAFKISIEILQPIPRQHFKHNINGGPSRSFEEGNEWQNLYYNTKNCALKLSDSLKKTASAKRNIGPCNILNFRLCMLPFEEKGQIYYLRALHLKSHCFLWIIPPWLYIITVSCWVLKMDQLMVCHCLREQVVNPAQENY